MKLEIRSVQKSFHSPGQILFGSKEKTWAVRNFSLTMSSGESIGLVGESGSGKTTLAKMVAGFFFPDKGEIQADGRSLIHMNRRERARTVQMVFQDPFSSINPKLLLGTQLMEGLKMGDVENPKLHAHQLMKDVGLSLDFLGRYPHQLSGGQRQRFAIARSLTMAPQLLIADEPVSSLDLSVQAQIINLLNDLRKKHQFMQIVISHDMAVIANLCTRVIIMKKGEVVEEGDMETILTQPKTLYAQQLLNATPVV